MTYVITAIDNPIFCAIIIKLVATDLLLIKLSISLIFISQTTEIN